MTKHQQYLLVYRMSHKIETKKYNKKYQQDRKDEIQIQRNQYRIQNKKIINGRDRQYYFDNKLKIGQKARERTSFLVKSRKKSGCKYCGIGKNLHFHHRDPADKVHNLSDMVSYSMKNIIDEISKCDVVCLPCHAKLHKLNRGVKYGFTKSTNTDKGSKIQCS